MAEKIYAIHNLDCPNCGAKIEAKFNQLPGVHADLTFATMQLRLRAEDPDALIPRLQELGRTVEPGFTIEPLTHHGHHEHCGCGHSHPEHRHHQEKEESDLPWILTGSVFFLLGLILSYFHLKILGGVSYVIAYGLLGWKIIANAVKNLAKGHMLDENFLMSIASLGAFVIGEAPEAVGVMLFYRIGEWFEHRATERSRKQIMEAVDLRPEVVNLVVGEELSVIPAEDALPGDLLLVRPGDRIPLDAVVFSGQSRLDTAPITGEPVPVSVHPGDSVLSGCVNEGSPLVIRVEKPLSESMVSRILRSVENAAAGKPKIDRFITRFARVYTPAVVIIAALTAVVPSLVDGRWSYWVYTALSFLVMSCPCALVLSVPLAFFSGIGVGSRKGILFKDGAAMETLSQVRAVVMDKTGTVTKGDFSVQQADPELLSLCAACEQDSTHPIAKSIVSAAKAQNLPLPRPEQLEEIPGHGIRAILDGQEILCGNEKLLKKFGISPEHREDPLYGTEIYIARDGALLGTIRISDTLKPGAEAAAARLKAQNVTTAILTGDREDAAGAVAERLGIDEVHARLLPEEKLIRLQDIRSRYGSAMFVGDGINDAPVLAGADVGAAMGTGADAAIEAADVVFMTGDVAAIPESLNIARRTRRIALQNVVFALAVKLVVMVLGLMGHASMWAAVFADSGVAMLCVLNSVRQLYRK